MRYLQEDFDLNEDQMNQFHAYYELLVEKNKVMNLTAITDEYEVYIKHFYDSLTISRVIEMSDVNLVMDVGTGAGFPGIPLKIAYPHIKLTLLDSLLKRVRFLEEVGTKLELKDVSYVHGRAEDFSQDPSYRESFDLVTSRAVAQLNKLAEFCLPFTSINGIFLAMKGSDVGDELQAAKHALHVLGRASHEIVSLSLPEDMGSRNLIMMKKTAQTPKKYPRKAGMIKNQPL